MSDATTAKDDPRAPMRIGLASGPLDGMCFIMDVEILTFLLPMYDGTYARYKATCDGLAEFDGYIDIDK